LRTFLLVGGMPESVKTWIEKSDYLACRYVQNDIIETYIDDFAKYKKRISPMIFKQTLRSVALQSGCKFVYSQVSHDMESAKIKFGIRTSMENFGRIGNIEIYPLYAIENFSFIKLTA